MTVEDFRQSLADEEPPVGLTPALAGLWWDAKVIGSGLTNRRRGTKAQRARGSGRIPQSVNARVGLRRSE